MQGTPNPDVNSPVTIDDSSVSEDVEQTNDNDAGGENEERPTSPNERRNDSIEEPSDTEKTSVEEN